MIITPKTKISELLEAYPELEEVLISAAPQFRKLKNPLLRRTIARITTLSQAAIVGGLKVEELINTLRAGAGQSSLDHAESSDTNYVKEKPGWFSESLVTETMDVREMLNAGEHPVHDVLAAVRKLGESQILKVIFPFIPAPLIDKSLSMGFSHWIVTKGDEEYWVYFKN